MMRHLLERRPSSIIEESASIDDVSLGSLESHDPLVGRDLDTADLARRENRAVSRLRGVVISVLLVATVLISATVYSKTSHAQEDNFTQAFNDASTKILEAFEENMKLRLQVMDSLAVDVSSYAQTVQASWPGVTMQDFSSRAASTQALANASSVIWLPLVTTETRTYWEDYSVQHSSWISGDAIASNRHSHFLDQTLARQTFEVPSISEHIFDSHGISTGPGPFAPLWQTAPVFPEVASWVNYDAFSLEGLQGGLHAVLDSREAVVGEVVNLEDFLSFSVFTLVSEKNMGEPISPIFYPVFDELHGGENSTVVAVLAFVSSWEFYFANVLPPSASGLIAVVQNECGQAFTFEIDGEQVQYLGTGDQHHGSFDSVHKSAGFVRRSDKNVSTIGSRYNSVDLNTDYCNYTLNVYPSLQMRADFVTKQPLIYAVMVSLIFLFATLIFGTYDCLVERRQKVVMNHAIQSTAIVSSLFPEQVRDRLFRRNSNDPGSCPLDDTTGRDDGSYVLFEPAKQRLKSFLDHDDQEGGGRQNSSEDKPIADLFPDCTVLFADIAGFTAWSSLRDPAQVFTLLEAVYQIFDKIARKRGVFKVETVGDSYVAVAGLPEPQPDHANIMCRFARDCRYKMNEVTHKLEVTLGPDTGDLKMRFGLHSGPVTAGVLRGEKSRFQLFGDTVNTAARMESTGAKDRIQLSQATADLLRQAGKGYWLKAREELVHAKGKGELQTYWFEPSNSRRSIGSVESEDSSMSKSGWRSIIWGDDDIPDIDIERNKHLRLIDYNVDLLTNLLKRVVARRRMLEMGGQTKDEEEPPTFLESATKGTVIDEVTEVIKLPNFDPKAFKEYVDPETIVLGPEVMSQLKRYVTIIGAMYRANPFHNFQHASHVTMSVNKLLQRVVAPKIRVRRQSLAASNEAATEQMASDIHNYTYGITSDPLTQFAVVFGALIHDVDHWGISNEQLVKEGGPIAQKYKNKSVAEQNSVDLAWDLLMNPDEYGELHRCIFPTTSEYKRFRQVVVNVVMATDIYDNELAELQKKRWAKAFEERVEPDSDYENRKATIVIEHIMQASDVAHSMQHWHVYQKWNRRLFDELYTAYKAGRMEKDPSTFWVEGEKKFFDAYVIPLAKKLKDCGVFGVASDECLTYAINNRKEWESKGHTIVEELVANYHQREKEEAEIAQMAAEESNGSINKKRRQRFTRRRSLFTSGG